MLLLVFGLSACGESTDQAADAGDTQQQSAAVSDALATTSVDQSDHTDSVQASTQPQPDRAQTQTQLGQPPPYQGSLPSLAAVNQRQAKLELVIDTLQQPWAFEFLNADEIIITEFAGNMQRLSLTDGQLSAIGGVPKVATSAQQTGLLDIALHPDFSRNRRLYFSYVISDPETGKYFKTVVDTATLVDDQLHDIKRIVSADPFGWSPSNFGGALAFDDQGYLYITIGDRSEGRIAQMGQLLQGKLLRLHDDGSVPADNPFVTDETIDDRIYALGLRNAQGLYFDAPSGLLFEAEHGPMGGDEVNIIRAGGNYGWPIITYGKSYTTASVSEHTHRRGMLQPLFYYLPSEAISPLLVYRGSMFPEWDGHLLVGALKGKHVSLLDFDAVDPASPTAGRIRSEYPILTEIDARIRDLKVDQQGAVYILTQTGSLYRLWQTDVAPATADKANPAAVIYEFVCAGCHDSGAGQAPMLSRPQQWQSILQQPRALTYQRVLDGYQDMPERGLCYVCTNAQLRATTDYILEQLVDATNDPE